MDHGVEIIEGMRIAIASTAFNEKIPKNSISASFGVASTKGRNYALPLLMDNADAALYRAKHHGRNRVETHAESTGFSVA